MLIIPPGQAHIICIFLLTNKYNLVFINIYYNIHDFILHTLLLQNFPLKKCYISIFEI